MVPLAKVHGVLFGLWSFARRLWRSDVECKRRGGSIPCGIIGRPSSTYVWRLHGIGRDSWDREKSEVYSDTGNPQYLGEEALAENLVAENETEWPHDIVIVVVIFPECQTADFLF